jgi:hypothetical protein
VRNALRIHFMGFDLGDQADIGESAEFEYARGRACSGRRHVREEEQDMEVVARIRVAARTQGALPFAACRNRRDQGLGLQQSKRSGNLQFAAAGARDHFEVVTRPR